jgi:hypothetical protein
VLRLDLSFGWAYPTLLCNPQPSAAQIPIGSFTAMLYLMWTLAAGR